MIVRAAEARDECIVFKISKNVGGSIGPVSRFKSFTESGNFGP